MSSARAHLVPIVPAAPGAAAAPDGLPVPRACPPATVTSRPPDPGDAGGLTLWAWQREALSSWNEAGRRGIVEAVTGTGKTRVGLAAILQGLAREERTVVLVPTAELQDQWYRELSRVAPAARISLLGGGHRLYGSWQVAVAVINSAASPLNERALSGADLLVADECHRYGAVGHVQALRSGHRSRLGLTATLERSDDGVRRVLLPYFARAFPAYGYDRAVPEGVVSPFRLALVGVHLTADEGGRHADLSDRLARLAKLLQRHVLPTRPFLEEVSRLAGRQDDAGRLASGFLALVSARRDLLASCQGKAALVPELAPLARGTRALVFTERKDAAKAAAAACRAVGVPAEALHGELPSWERRDLLARFARGQLEVLCAPRVLDEGVDVPEADLAIVLGATRTRRQMVQRMGRVLRRKQDGREARFVLTFAVGTAEDPRCGAHEGFLNAVSDVASAQRTFLPGVPVTDVHDYLTPVREPWDVPPLLSRAATAPLPDRPAATTGPDRIAPSLREVLAGRQRERAGLLGGPYPSE